MPVDAGLEALLGDLSSDRRELFELRVRRWLPDLRAALTALYSAEAASALEKRVLVSAAAAYRDRPPDLHRLDLVRTLAPAWFQAPPMRQSVRSLP